MLNECENNEGQGFVYGTNLLVVDDWCLTLGILEILLYVFSKHNPDLQE